MRRRTVLGLAAALSVALAGVSAAGEGRLRRYVKLKGDAIQLARKNTQLEEDCRRLRREVRALKNDPRAAERAAREELGMVGRDEVVFTFE